MHKGTYMCKDYREISSDIVQGRITEAMKKLDEAMSCGNEDATLHYLRGNAYRKQGRWAEAINCYLAAEAIDPDSPAAEARSMLNDIFAFYNKDMYNQ